MSRICQELHDLVNIQPRFYYPSSDISIPNSGIYFMFENGEVAHGKDRIVMIGTHRSEGGLISRIKQHYTNDKDGSIFRKNIGRSILNVRQDPYAAIWEIDMSKRRNQEEHSLLRIKEYEKTIEAEVSWYIKENFSFCAIEVDNKDERLKLKAKLIATISQCDECRPSCNWFGLNSPVQDIRESGMWQEKGLDGEQIEPSELELIKEMCSTK